MNLLAPVLTGPVLQLNKNWLPIRVITVMDALCKLYDGTAKAVSEDYNVYDFDDWAALRVNENEPYITTAKLKLKVPDVIVLLTYGDIPDKKLACTRANIYKRDHYTCQYCGSRPGTEELTIDHITPRSKGGKTEWTNCVLACWKCNSKKANKTVAESGLKLKKHPIKPDWSPRMVIAKVRNTPEAWKKFVSDAYWNTTLNP
jgi:5-methylcytosine-specific restriction endonuclease McrA